MQSGIYMKTDPEGSIGYWQVKNITPEKELDPTSLATVKSDNISDKHWLRKGDLLFSAKGVSIFCTYYNQEEIPSIASAAFIVLRIKSKEVLPEFICFFLNLPSIIEYLKNSSVGTGIQIIPQSILGELELNVPPIEIQKLMVDINQLTHKSEQLKFQIFHIKQDLQEQLFLDILN